ncbi:MAG: hypothetical protein FK734_15900 [Asgard group archaeon]|nr:hypothetical protein [Asgard group archaeon]
MTIKDLKSKLLVFFRIKYNDASNFKISNIHLLVSNELIEMYSFNLKCKHKNEPYDLNFIIRLYLDDNNTLAEQEYNFLKLLFDKNYSYPRLRYGYDLRVFFGKFSIILEIKKDMILPTTSDLADDRQLKALGKINAILLSDLQKISQL